MEEIGECYFNDLINRSMIQPVGIQYDGRADACRVHDMILDLIISKSVEENFVTLCGDQNHKLMPQVKVRRLSLNYYARDHIIVPTNMIVSNVRSLTIFGHFENMPCISNSSRVFYACTVTKVHSYVHIIKKFGDTCTIMRTFVYLCTVPSTFC